MKSYVDDGEFGDYIEELRITKYPYIEGKMLFEEDLGRPVLYRGKRGYLFNFRKCGRIAIQFPGLCRVFLGNHVDDLRWG